MRRLLIPAVIGLLLGCQQSQPPSPAVAPAGSLTALLKGEGDQLAARGDYAEAVEKYGAAVEHEPGDGSLWYALGVALSHVGRREETVAAFQRVVDLGQPEAEEVRVARAWLVRAGVLAESVSFARPSAPASTTAAPLPGPKGSVRGRTGWPGVSVDHLISVRVVLSGDDSTIRGRNFSRRIRLGDSYAFENIPPGTYRLKVRAARTRLWNERVTVEADKQTVLDLSAANSRVSPEEFPGTRHTEDEDASSAEHERPGTGEPPPAGS